MGFFACYITLGILSNFIGPLALKINQEICIIKIPSSVDMHGNLELAVDVKTQILFEIIIRTPNITLYPVLYILMGIGHFRKRKNLKSKTVLFRYDKTSQRNHRI